MSSRNNCGCFNNLRSSPTTTDTSRFNSIAGGSGTRKRTSNNPARPSTAIKMKMPLSPTEVMRSGPSMIERINDSPIEAPMTAIIFVR